MYYPTKKDKRKIFTNLIWFSQYQVGMKIGLSRYFRNKWSLISYVQRIYREVKDNPKKFGITEGVVEMVERTMQKRYRKDKKGEILMLSDWSPNQLMEYPGDE